MKEGLNEEVLELRRRLHAAEVEVARRRVRAVCSMSRTDALTRGVCLGVWATALLYNYPAFVGGWKTALFYFSAALGLLVAYLSLKSAREHDR